MIQRVQSLLLLGVALISGLLIYLPVYEKIPMSLNNPEVVATQIGIGKSAILQLLNGAVGILALLAIFMYKKRNIQIRMCNLALLLACVFIALLFFMADTMSSEDERIKYLVGSYLPLIQVLLAFLAIRFIKKDEELIRSADRLR